MSKNSSIDLQAPQNSLRRSGRNKISGPNDHPPDQADVKSEDNGDEYGFLNYRNVRRMRLGKYEFDTWYGNSALFKVPFYDRNINSFRTSLSFKDESIASANVSPPKAKSLASKKLPPKEYVINPKKKDIWLDLLYVCPYCFKFTDIRVEWEQHINCCGFRRKLPGKVMYSDGEVVIRKIKGFYNKLFCQNMCLMAKFFLDNKSVFYYLDYFDFYVAYQMLDRIEVPMGFYSRELLSWDLNNLSCICVLPCYQHRHLGTKLIDFSYQLSRYEQQISGPEHPLSPLGKLTYLKYWCSSIAKVFVYGSLSNKKFVTLQMISEITGFRIEDILMTLSCMKVLYQSGTKTKNMDYYQDSFKYSDHYIFVEDEKNYKVMIDKKKMKRWVVDNMIENVDLLNKNCFVFY